MEIQKYIPHGKVSGQSEEHHVAAETQQVVEGRLPRHPQVSDQQSRVLVVTVGVDVVHTLHVLAVVVVHGRHDPDQRQSQETELHQDDLERQRLHAVAHTNVGQHQDRSHDRRPYHRSVLEYICDKNKLYG